MIAHSNVSLYNENNNEIHLADDSFIPPIKTEGRSISIKTSKFCYDLLNNSLS